MTEAVWGQWLVVAMLAPFFTALVNILDIHFVSSVYEDEFDGTIISSLFQSMPWLLLLFGIVSFQYPGHATALLAILAGGLLAITFFFYFKALFHTNDMVSVQVMGNLSILLVPFLAWMIAGEKLSIVHYAGIGLAFLGTIILSLSKRTEPGRFRDFSGIVFLAVLALSLSMVIQEMVYERIGYDFWTGFLLFSAGSGLTGLFLSVLDTKTTQERFVHIFEISRKNFFVFVLAETLSLLGVLASQRAIDLSPAVSFVAVMESLSPIFVLLLSGALALLFLVLNKERAQTIYQDQFSSFWIKTAACAVVVFGVYLVS